MQDLTYARYLEDPNMRTAIDDEVVRLRHEAIDRCIVEPVRRVLQHAWRTSGPAAERPACALPRSGAFEATLNRGDSFVIEHGKGLVLTLRSGCLWVTQDGDREDHVLGPQQVFRARRAGAIFVHALKPVALVIAHQEQAASVVVASTRPAGARHAMAASARHLLGHGLGRAREVLARLRERQPVSA